MNIYKNGELLTECAFVQVFISTGNTLGQFIPTNYSKIYVFEVAQPITSSVGDKSKWEIGEDSNRSEFDFIKPSLQAGDLFIHIQMKRA